MKQYYFISGLPRSGSTLLSAILKQNPEFYADISSPVDRIVETTIYLGFTSILNLLYESKILLNKKIIKGGFYFLKNFKQARDIFIKQAMGRINLTD